MKKILVTLCFLLALFSAVSQVRDVRQKAAKDKSSSGTRGSSGSKSGSSSSFTDDDDGCFDFIVFELFYHAITGAFKGVYYAQSYTLQQKADRPELISFQAALSSGYDYKFNAFTTIPALRGNWGVFASDLRMVHVHDVTGNMQMVDWQVLMVRLPIQNVKLEYGIGFTHLWSPSATYFEQSAGVELNLFNGDGTVQGGYRWSQMTSLDERFRQELNLEADYQVAMLGSFRLCPMVGYTWQNYFDSSKFNFFRVGMKFKLY